jgi:hypothetical protein
MQTFPAYTIGDFSHTVMVRLHRLKIRTGHQEFRLPVGIFLVIDEESGGDQVAQEIAKRFRLLNNESRDLLDFYFLGWLGPGCATSHGRIVPRLTFDPDSFSDCRRGLESVGVRRWGGNADLILVDAQCTPTGAVLRFDQAIQIDLSRGVSQGDLPSLGGFLQSIVDAASAVRAEMRRQRHGRNSSHGPVWLMSDKLGIAVSKESLLNWFLEKWGAIIGGKQLAALSVRNLAGPCSLPGFEPLGPDVR